MRVFRKDGKIYIELPPEVKGVNVKKLSNDVYALVLRRHEDKAEAKEAVEKPADETKEKLLKKLYSIPFRKREIANLKGEFTRDEIQLLKELLSDKKVFIYKKDGRSYIALSNDVYTKLKQEAEELPGNQDYVNYGIFSPEDARKIVERAPQLYAAVRHFDGRVYLAKKPLFLEWKKRLLLALKKGPTHVEELSAETGIEQQAVIITLRILNEMGEVVEIKKDTFALADYQS